MITIDGSHGSGGGAILRVATGLAAVTGKDIRVTNIRDGRPNPGLRAQHVEGLKAIAALTQGTVTGAREGSKIITFRPGSISDEDVNVTIGTAGSIGLIFQILKLPALHAPDDVTINVKGGATFGKWAPPVLYTEAILLPVLKSMGCTASLRIEKHGFYPAGGARVSYSVKPASTVKPLQQDGRGPLTHVGGLSVASRHLRNGKVAERQARSAERVLKQHGFSPLIKEVYVDADSPGSGIVLWATDGTAILGDDAIGERGKKAEVVGREAAESLTTTLQSGATIDPYLSDQILPVLALADGDSSFLTPFVSNHAKTNMWLIEQLCDVKFSTQTEGKAIRVTCTQNTK